MRKKQLTATEKRLDTDLWIIALVTMGVFLCCAVTGDRLMGFVRDSSIPVLPGYWLTLPPSLELPGRVLPSSAFCEKSGLRSLA